MNSQTNFYDPYLNDEESKRLRNCISLRKTLLLLASRKSSSAYRHKQNRRISCLQWLRQWGSIGIDDPSLVDVLYDVITQYIFQKMPKEYFTESCKFHNYTCHCMIGRRENFVLRKLHEMNVDVNRLRPQIDAAFIMTLENDSRNPTCDGRLVASGRNFAHLVRRKRILTRENVSQLAVRIGNTRPHSIHLPENRDRVVVEYLPMNPHILRNALQPRNINISIRSLSGGSFEEDA